MLINSDLVQTCCQTALGRRRKQLGVLWSAPKPSKSWPGAVFMAGDDWKSSGNTGSICMRPVTKLCLWQLE
jgi:hypothetical protein